MTKRTTPERTTAALRALDSATTTTLTEQERQRADAMFSRILATPGYGRGDIDTLPRRRRSRALIPLAVLTTVALVVLTALGGGSAFASWTATPVPLSGASGAAAAATCSAALDLPDQGVGLVIGERRGGWTYVLLDGPGGQGTCLMPDKLVGTSGAVAVDSGFFGSFDRDPVDAPSPAPDGIVEMESAGGTVSLPGQLPFRTMEGWFMWVTGVAGRDVTAVTVHPPVGPDVEASLAGGRFSAWWPAGEARGDNPGAGAAWSYTVTLADGTTRREVKAGG